MRLLVAIVLLTASVATAVAGSIEVLVQDKETAEPIWGAIVVLDSAERPLPSALTNAAGRATIEDLEPGTYSAAVYYGPGKEPTRFSVEVSAGKKTVSVKHRVLDGEICSDVGSTFDRDQQFFGALLDGLIGSITTTPEACRRQTFQRFDSGEG